MGIFLAASSGFVRGQQSPSGSGSAIIDSAQSDSIPDAPQPQIEVAEAQSQQSSTGQSTANPNPAPAANTTGHAPAPSASQTQDSQTQQPDTNETQHDKAQQEVQEQEKQRVLGIMPTFNLTYRHDAVSLSASQKIGLAFHSATDPFAFAGAFVVAGLHETTDSDPGFGWGAEGYFKRSGAAYLDALDGTMIGNGFLPALLRQDPRYFRLGHGTFKHRILYAVMTNFVCKGDSGHWQPNISNVSGNIIAGALSNLYYPSQNSGWGQTISNGMIVTTEGAIGSIFDEFWPDISRKFLHRDPTHGLDAQQAAEDARAKQKKQQEQNQQ